ncbi:MAG: hypothetical protein HoeaKO_19270 [Hoeflea alexandrii]
MAVAIASVGILSNRPITLAERGENNGAPPIAENKIMYTAKYVKTFPYIYTTKAPNKIPNAEIEIAILISIRVRTENTLPQAPAIIK